MYLTKVVLDRSNPDVLHALVDCQKMHQLVMRLFSEDRQTSQVLYRTNLDGEKLELYMYSGIPVSPAARASFNLIQKDMSAWLSQMKGDLVLQFDLIASPCKKVKFEGKRRSQRRVLKTPDERSAWLYRKATQHGFEILSVVERDHFRIFGRHDSTKGGMMNHNAYHYQGVLRITDAEAFRNVLQSGIGPGKAYGLGMMLVK